MDRSAGDPPDEQEYPTGVCRKNGPDIAFITPGDRARYSRIAGRPNYAITRTLATHQHICSAGGTAHGLTNTVTSFLSVKIEHCDAEIALRSVPAAGLGLGSSAISAMAHSSAIMPPARWVYE